MTDNRSTDPAVSPVPPRPPRLLSNVQIAFTSILAISLLLVISFSGRIAAGHRVQDERNTLLNSIGTLSAQATALQGQYYYVNGDEYLRTWAHGEGKMVLPGEVLVVPVPGVVTPQPTPTPLWLVDLPTVTPDAQTWTVWWRLFFDSPPPN